MALTDEVQGRMSATRLIGLTNPDNAGATTIDTARLNYAIADVQAAFEEFAGVVYDNAIARHINAAIECVLWRLEMFHVSADADELQGKIKKRLEDLRRVTANDRIQPASTSVLTTSDEQVSGEEVRPDFDRTRFGPLLPEAPAAQDPLD